MNSSPLHTPTLATVIAQAISASLRDLHTAMPGQIESYDSTTAKANILPLINRQLPDGTILQLPVIQQVPVCWPRTSQGIIHFPLQRGDGVLVIFSERSLDEWLTAGGSVAPEDKRIMDLTDAIAIPGLFDFSKTTPALNDNASLNIIFKEQSIRIDGSGNISIGASSTQAVLTAAYKLALETQLQLIATALNSAGFPVAPFSPPANSLTSKAVLQ